MSYGMPESHLINDVFAVNEVANEAIQRAREGNGPTLIELLTYRIGGHLEMMHVIIDLRNWMITGLIMIR